MLRIDIVFDTVCPWCYVGKRRLDSALRMRPEVVAEVVWRPFLLNPDMPPAGMDRSVYLARKFGSQSRIQRVYGAVAEAGQSVEIDFAFDRIRRTPNSVDSHRLVRFAERHGKADAAVESLFLHYFINGRNIGDREILLGLGADLGLDADALAVYLESEEDAAFVYEENARAHRRGIDGVPAFVFGRRLAISGAHEATVLARMIDAAQALDESDSGDSEY